MLLASTQVSLQKTDKTFESAARLFRVLSSPMRLKILHCLCNGEENVGQLIGVIQTSQPNMSQHLNALFQAGILGKRRVGTQILYHVMDVRIVAISEVICRRPQPLP
ncbi:MAG: metalloregulator ArsR/SmtB family transcription factor [Rhodoferax sp.]|uniref:ArsR/SmtB family transcription factor n=1 Tax=Rhodoferax sp. TaxID=50421 RepID=UPI0008BD8466|nr:metalloregulator ArsR/SmtB family transcription factor [Rhodoferax sp.]MDP2678134.1 metalloregulator ArsR/SmtB family transcription factor [Rhodoferax sp.]OGB80400.1 MAG: transcriptional regulator [Burkholderiales bacterium RIFOXYC12_FULL_60_6]